MVRNKEVLRALQTALPQEGVLTSVSDGLFRGQLSFFIYKSLHKALHNQTVFAQKCILGTLYAFPMKFDVSRMANALANFCRHKQQLLFLKTKSEIFL